MMITGVRGSVSRSLLNYLDDSADIHTKQAISETDFFQKVLAYVMTSRDKIWYWLLDGCTSDDDNWI